MLHDYDLIEKRLQILVLYFHSAIGWFELWTQYPGSVVPLAMFFIKICTIGVCDCNYKRQCKMILDKRIWRQIKIYWPYSSPLISSVRSSSGYHGLLEIRQQQQQPLFQIFQILQILKWKWKWKDPTSAIFLKSMGFKDIEYDIPVYQM